MSLIVVEGVDGSGKTTLVSELSEQLGHECVVKHRGPLKLHPLVEYQHDLLKYEPSNEVHFVCDRWHIGEMVYGPLYRGETRLTPAMRRHIELFLDSRGAVKIIVDVPLDVVKHRLAHRGEDFLQNNDVALVHDWYSHYGHENDGWVHVDPEDTVRAAGAIIDLANWRASLVSQSIARFKTYVGHGGPDVLFLGLHKGPQVSGRPVYPSAFVPYANTSGHYLLSALEAVQFHDNQTYGLANAAEEPDLYGLWLTIGEPKVVALGKDVFARVRASNIPREAVYAVEHPSKIRRSHPANVHLYGRKIETILKEGSNA
jgi:deoxyadenosine/deoxycytidine kinase